MADEKAEQVTDVFSAGSVRESFIKQSASTKQYVPPSDSHCLLETSHQVLTANPTQQGSRAASGFMP